MSILSPPPRPAGTPPAAPVPAPQPGANAPTNSTADTAPRLAGARSQRRGRGGGRGNSAAAPASRADAGKAALRGMSVGDTLAGVVKSLTTFGAFVNLGAVDGMIHISELAPRRVQHPSEVIEVGDSVT